MKKQNTSIVALVFMFSFVFLLATVSATPAFTMTFNNPTEGAILNTDNFIASISANEVLDTMDINLDGSAYYHACDNCNGFTVPVDRLLDGPHTLHLIGVSGSTTKSILLNFTTDTTAPTVPAVSPAVGATGVAANTNVVATFSENIQTSTVTGSTFTLRDSGNAAVAGSVSASGNTATFNPTSDLQAGMTYTATLTSGIRDLAGNSITQGSWTFTVTGSSPGNTTNTTNTTTPSGPHGSYILAFTTPTEDQVFTSSSFTAVATANETLDVMRINLDGGAHIVGCTNCNGFSVPVNNLQDGQHTLNLIGEWGTFTKDITINFSINTAAPDTTAPAPVSGLSNSVLNSTSAGWTWTNPVDSDFQSAILLLNGVNEVNTSSGTYSNNNLQANTTYNLTIYTKDSTGNVNMNGVSSIVTTLPVVYEQNNTQNSTNTTQPTLGAYLVVTPLEGASYDDAMPINIQVGSATVVNYSIDDGYMIDYAGATTVSLAAGSHTIAILASDDDASNTTVRTFTIVNTTIPVNNTNSTGNSTDNSTGNNNSSEMEMFAIDSPINGSTYNDALVINITKGNMTDVNYTIDGGQMVNYTAVANIPLSSGLHNITVRASDSAIFSESTVYFTIVNTTIPVDNTNSNNGGNNNVNNNGNGGSGGGSGGSSSASKLFKVTSSATVSGYTQTLGTKDKIQFSLIGESSARHVLMINSISNNSVSFRVENIVFSLGVGETARFNLTSAEDYDLEVTVNSINNGKVSVTVKAINVEMPENTIQSNANVEVNTNDDRGNANTETQVSSTITGNAVSETETDRPNRGIFRVFNFIQNIFRNMFGSIGGLFNR